MKVLIVFNHPAPYKVRLFNALSKSVDLTVIFERKKASDRPDSFYNCNEYNFKHIFLKHGAIGKEGSISSELVRYIKVHHQEFDLIVMNGYSHLAEIKAIHYLAKHHIPYVQYVNGGVIKKESKLKRHIKTKLVSSASYYLSPSKEANDYLIHYGAKKENIYLYTYSSIENKDVLNKPLSKEEKDKIRETYNLPKGKLFISASQFIDRKNNLFLIDVFKDLDASLVLIGEGEEKDKYLSFIDKNNVKNVQILHYFEKNELFKIMQCADYFITLSKEDIYGHTINEAMANGLPVISSDRVVSAHKLIDGKNGLIVNIDDKENVKSAINSVNESMKEYALKTARENTIEISAKEMSKIFKELIK